MFPLKDNIPTEHFPVVTVALIALNVLAYFFFQHGTLSFGDPSDQQYLQNLFDYAWIPIEISEGVQCVPDAAFQQVQCGPNVGADQPPVYLTLFTAMFMHGGLLHLGGNMLFLWIFGNNVEDSMGPIKFIVFYLLAGIAATALQTVINTDSAVPNIGASGAVAGVLGGYLLLFPRARVITVIFIIFFFTIVELPALLILGFWFVQQVLFGYFGLSSGGEGGGVAYFAHIGGFVFGLLAIKVFASERRRRRQIERVGGLT
ncbi:MAG TPA: rhomboid family intramembrane serine protease [Kofleriaceae bacterium]|nr:rhomboid family intramembrane serine protease [Kofleriaceae bacterium]